MNIALQYYIVNTKLSIDFFVNNIFGRLVMFNCDL